MIFFNFRPDRAREITRAFCDDAFTGFDRDKRLELGLRLLLRITMRPSPISWWPLKKEAITNTLGQFLADHHMTQARIAETEKYAHVTFFFNGGVEEPNPGEERILVKSPKVATYDKQPEMSAPAVCDKLVEAIGSGKYDVIIINFANPDMVGHTGVENAAIQAVEAVDACVGKSRGGHRKGGRRNVHLRGSRQCGAAGGLSDRRTVHSAYDEPGAVYSGECRRRVRPQRGRLPGRYCSDAHRAHGDGTAEGDDWEVFVGEAVRRPERRAGRQIQ